MHGQNHIKNKMGYSAVSESATYLFEKLFIVMLFPMWNFLLDWNSSVKFHCITINLNTEMLKTVNEGNMMLKLWTH